MIVLTVEFSLSLLYKACHRGEVNIHLDPFVQSNPRPCLTLEDILTQLHTHILGHSLHLRLNAILHTTTKSQELPHLREPEKQVRAEQHYAEQQMATKVPQLLRCRQVRRLDKRAGRPSSGNLDAVDGRAQELVVGLNDAKVAANEDQWAGPFGLIAEYVTNCFAGSLLHFVVARGTLRFAEPFEGAVRREVAAAVRSHQGRRGEEVSILDAPAAHDGVKGGVIEGEKGFPEAGVLVSEFGVHLDVESVIDEDKLRMTGRSPADEDVAWVRIAVDYAPEEHLCGEEVYHSSHDFLKRKAETSAGVSTAPVIALGLNLGRKVRIASHFGDKVFGVARIERRAMAAWGAAAPTATPSPRDGVLVPEADTFNPLGGHDTLRAELAVDLRNVHAAAETGLSGDQTRHVLGVVGLILKVGLKGETLRHIRNQAVEWDIKGTAVDPGNDSVLISILCAMRGAGWELT